MYILVLFGLLALGGYLFLQGKKLNKKTYKVLGISIIAVDILFFCSLTFLSEFYWFASHGFEIRFLKQLSFQIFNGVVFTLLGAGILGFMLSPIKKELSKARGILVWGVPFVLAVFMGVLNWDVTAKFMYQVSSGETDPLYGLDLSFYIFTLPLINLLGVYLFLLAFTNFVCVFIFKDYLLEKNENNFNIYQVRSFGGVLIILGLGHIAGLFMLVNSSTGIVHGAGWTDTYIRLPMLALFSLLFILFGIIVSRVKNFEVWNDKRMLRQSVSLASFWLITLMLLPWGVQAFIVEPNEISFEKRYLERNIKFTQKAFALDNVVVKRVEDDLPLTKEIVDRNRDIFNEVRLWDWRTADKIFDQFQEIRLYYQFKDIDIDRYKLGNSYRQVLIAPREINLDSLPARNQTFVNKRFKYTHGHGAVVASVNDIRADGLPRMLVKDIPPKSRYQELVMKRPEIYFGSADLAPVIVNSLEEELDYPYLNRNVYTSYKGNGGVPLDTLFKKIVYGWRFDGTRLLFSSAPSRESRIMFYRNIEKRVTQLAPFLKFDRDPYLVIADEQLYWIMDAYTTAWTYPYSEPFQSYDSFEMEYDEKNVKLFSEYNSHLKGVNYIRNSVKAVVNAYNGEVKFYVFDKNDVLVQTWMKMFPKLFVPKDELSSSLMAHIRYPSDYLQAQGQIYSKYHMNNIEVFYNQEDRWSRATEKYRRNMIAVDPYYIMWKRTIEDPLEFVLMQPFTPRGKQLLSGWLAGGSDGEQYGKLVAYKFSKKTKVLGPQQVETRIDQHPEISQKLSLWDQRGSSVIRGNLLAIPVEDTVVYIEPIFIKSVTASYPELRMVIAMSNSSMGYGSSLNDALDMLLDESNLLSDQYFEDVGASEGGNILSE